MNQFVSRRISRREYNAILAAERSRLNGIRMGIMLGLLLVPAILAFLDWRNSPCLLTASHVQQRLDTEHILDFNFSEFSECDDAAVGTLIAKSPRSASFSIPLSESVQRELGKKKTGVLSFDRTYNTNTNYLEYLKPLLESSAHLEFTNARMTPEDARLFVRHKGSLGFWGMSLQEEDFEAVKKAFDQHAGPVWFALDYGWPGSVTKRLIIRNGHLPEGFNKIYYEDR